MTEIMNFPSSRSSSLPLSLTGHVIARSYAVQEHPRTLTPPPPPPSSLYSSHTRVQVRRIHASVEHLRANLARLWKQFTSRRLSSLSLVGARMGGWVLWSRSRERESKREGREKRETGATGWPETTLEHCNSSNVSFMQNTC